MIEVDNKKVLEDFANLSPKNQTKAFKNALKKAASILVKETKKNLKQVVGKINTKHTYTNKKGKQTFYSLQKGVTTNKGTDTEIKVHIMKDFRLKFFEKGTKERSYISKHGKVHRTGHNTASYYFKSAQSTKEKEVFASINKLLMESINRIAKKK